MKSLLMILSGEQYLTTASPHVTSKNVTKNTIRH